MSVPVELVRRLEAGRDAVLATRARAEAGAPWALSPAFGTEPEASWGPPETLAHIAEMLPFWLGEADRVLSGMTEPVPFGRIASDANRLAAIERDRREPLAVLYARIDEGVDGVVRRLAALTPREAERRGVHPTIGELSVAGLLERFVVRHLEEHARQLETVLDAHAARLAGPDDAPTPGPDPSGGGR